MNSLLNSASSSVAFTISPAFWSQRFCRDCRSDGVKLAHLLLLEARKTERAGAELRDLAIVGDRTKGLGNQGLECLDLLPCGVRPRQDSMVLTFSSILAFTPSLWTSPVAKIIQRG